MKIINKVVNKSTFIIVWLAIIIISIAIGVAFIDGFRLLFGI